MFIVSFHRIDALDAMMRSSLALDAPNSCGYSRSELRFPKRGETRMVSDGYEMMLLWLEYHVKICLREKSPKTKKLSN